MTDAIVVVCARTALLVISVLMVSGGLMILRLALGKF